jgi:tripeptide aminopeptidase
MIVLLQSNILIPGQTVSERKGNDTMKAYERLLKYVTVRTPSDENSETVPSSQCQFDLAKILETEMKELGLKDVHLDDQCYLYGNLPATEGYEDKPAIGFIAHMDTVADFCDHDIVPVLTENYDGKAMEIGKSGLILSPETFPHLASLKGRTLITSDGTTILGADDKAGIAEILTMIERVQNDNIPHGKLCVAFTPDEEIGTGASHFNVEEFGADYAYTMDGDTEGEIQYENFNACKACFDIKGFNVHPGSSKDTMINASLVAIEINNMLPGCETPRGTQEYEGFYHLVSMSGECASAQLNYIVRDHDKNLFEARKKTLRLIEKDLNEKWGKDTVTLTITEQYKNMAEIIAGCMHLIDNAKTACESADVTPLVIPIRGGTDGCQLSFKGLPCPNLGTGGHAYHGPYEHITVEGMDKSVDVMMELVKLYAK